MENQVICYYCQWYHIAISELNDTFTLKKQLNIDFTRMNDQRETHLTYNRAKMFIPQGSQG